MAENQNAAEQASTLNDERATRLGKRAALFEAGQNPYPEHSDIEDYVVDIEAKYAELADGEDTEDVVKIGGRVVAKRGQGKIMFIVLRDSTGEIQLFCRINDMDEVAWKTLKALDLGDILGVTGVVVRTQRGQLSVAPKSATLLSKAVRPLPEKFHGLSDKETRYRQRYVDLIANDDVRETFRKRSQILSTFRRFMESDGYMEVETPILQTSRVAPRLSRSSRTSTRSIRSATCALLLSCTLSATSSAVLSVSSRSAASSATRAWTSPTTPSSPRWRPTAPSPISRA